MNFMEAVNSKLGFLRELPLRMYICIILVKLGQSIRQILMHQTVEYFYEIRNIFCCDISVRDNNRNNFCRPISNYIFSGTKSHVSHYLLNDKVHFVWMSAVMQRLVIKLSKQLQICV